MIRQGKDTDKEALIQMWKYCFPQDSDRFVSFYFDRVYVNEEMLVYEENTIPVASLQMIPYRINTGDNFFLGGYISGAMTHPDFRKKGYMDALLKASFDEMIKKNYDYTFLIPQEEGLIAMYSKYGYRLCDPNRHPPKNKVVKTPKQWSIVQQSFFDENSVWLTEESVFPNEHKGMIKRLNPDAEEITSLYMGLMLD